MVLLLGVGQLKCCYLLTYFNAKYDIRQTDFCFTHILRLELLPQRVYHPFNMSSCHFSISLNTQTRTPNWDVCRVHWRR